jgi:transposase
MSIQHTIDQQPFQDEQDPENPKGIVIPLELPGLCLLSQRIQADGSIEVEVIGTNQRAPCPRCQQSCVKVHDTRLRRKRDVSLRGYRVVLVLHKRRCKCFRCRRPFTEADSACGRYRHTTVRLRECIGLQATRQPLAQVALAFEVGPCFVQQCLETVARPQLAKRGLSMDETAPLPTPRYLGIDEFARRKGHRYDSILCDLDKRQVLEVSAGRQIRRRRAPA